MKNQKISKATFIILSLCVLLGIFIRAYNIGYDDLWFDEILSFWVADPNISIKESFQRHTSIEGVPFLYNFLLKFFFSIF